jgi:hypothetical protein
MKKSLILLFTLIYLSVGYSQTHTIDSLKIKPENIAGEYKVLTELKCQSFQSRLLYDDPSMYSFILGNLQEKAFQSFELNHQTGSILYLVFDKKTENAQGFIQGLLWGGEEPSKGHPEEIITNGNTMIIISYPYKSDALSYFKKALTE